MKYTVNVICGEYPITIEGSVTDELPAEGFFASLADYLRNEALIPVDTTPAPAGNSRSREHGPVPQSLGAGYSANGGAPAPAQRPAMRPPAAAPQGNWECPVHGNEDIGVGYGGKGLECKVWTADPATDDPRGEWVRMDQDGNYKAAVMRDNSVRYWCRNKSTSGGGGRRY